MKRFILVVFVLFIGFKAKAEAAYIQNVPQCQILATHVDVADCFNALNVTHKPDTTTCGPLDLTSIMRSVDVNNSALVGGTWRRLGSLVLSQCGYSSEAKNVFLALEKTLFGGPESRERASLAWRRQVCIKAERDRFDELTVEQRAKLYLVFVGNTYFGGGISGMQKADEYLRRLASSQNQVELDKLASDFLESRIKSCL